VAIVIADTADRTAETQPRLLLANVFHKRLFPKENAFRYAVYYVDLPVTGKPQTPFAGCYGLLSFHPKDHQCTDFQGLREKINLILKQENLSNSVTKIRLIAMPRVTGYVFNPVSFWLCEDQAGKLRAVLCAVNNTFGEQHDYLCAHADGREIESGDVLKARKTFHVSPFLPREGFYEFRFSSHPDKLDIRIDYFDANGKKQLITSLIGRYAPLTRSTALKTFFTHPLVTLKAIFLIHWQAVKLLLKGIRYIPKPKQNTKKFDKTNNPVDFP
jgi:uncharacterized protein